MLSSSVRPKSVNSTISTPSTTCTVHLAAMPNYFLSNQQTKDLIAEIQIAGIPAISAKPRIGTYACRELVIAYAAWISPAFHLKVIRVFLDAAVSSPKPSFLTPAADQSKVSHLQLHVLDIRPHHKGLRLNIRCGEIGFGVIVPPGFETKIGDCLMAEYPKEDNPLNTKFTAIYPQRLQPITCVTPDWDWTTIGSRGLAALAATCNKELAQRLGA
jgi:hypothetical protein